MDIVTTGFNLLLAIWPVIAVGAVELINFFKKKIGDSSLPGPVRWATAFLIGGILKAMPPGGEINPDEIGLALLAFVGAILATVKLRDEIKKKITGDPIK